MAGCGVAGKARRGNPCLGPAWLHQGLGGGRTPPGCWGRNRLEGVRKGGGFSSLSPQGERGAFHSVLKSKPSGLTPPLCSTWPRARAGGFQNVG